LNNDNIYGFLGSLLFHFILILLMAFSVLRTVPPDEEEGVLVNFGNVNAAAGTFEPQYQGSMPYQPPTPPTAVQPSADREDLLTQDMEESVAIEEARKRDNRRREEEAGRIAEEARKRQEEQQRQQNAISSRVAGAFGSGNTANTNQGDAPAGTGNQGNPFGNADHGALDGTGGYGGFSLSGRKLATGELPRPSYDVQEEGRIVIDITVDPRGNVIDADINRQRTNITNLSLRRSALEAARRAKFTSIEENRNQSGTITYNYRITQ
jgi:TonB family protein